MKQQFIRIAGFAVLFCVLGATTQAQDLYKLGSVAVEKGEKATGHISISTGTKGPEIKLPITVLRGLWDGPVLILAAGVYSPINPPIDALNRIENEIDLSELYGKVIIVRTVKRSSFLRRTIYHSPPEGLNLNRIYPGKISGSISERISYRITKEIIEQCDYLIDLHCSNDNENVPDFVYSTNVGNPFLIRQTTALGRYSGYDLIINKTYRPVDNNALVSLSSRALFRGKPAITIESGVDGYANTEKTDRIVSGIYNVMKHLDMLDGIPEVVSGQLWIKTSVVIRADHDGIFLSIAEKGDNVHRGDSIGYLTDAAGTQIQTVEAPFDGIILFLTAKPQAYAGEPVVIVGEPVERSQKR